MWRRARRIFTRGNFSRKDGRREDENKEGRLYVTDALAGLIVRLYVSAGTLREQLCQVWRTASQIKYVFHHLIHDSSVLLRSRALPVAHGSLILNPVAPRVFTPSHVICPLFFSLFNTLLLNIDFTAVMRPDAR